MDTFDVLGWLLVLNLRCQPSTEAIGWQISKMRIHHHHQRDALDMLDPFAVEFPAQIVPADPTSGRLHGCLSPACFAASGFFISFIDCPSSRYMSSELIFPERGSRRKTGPSAFFFSKKNSGTLRWEPRNLGRKENLVKN